MRKIYVHLNHDWNRVYRLESEGYKLSVQRTNDDIEIIFDSNYNAKVKHYKFYDFGEALAKLFYNYQFSKYRCILEVDQRWRFPRITKFVCKGHKRDWKKLLN